MLRLASGRLPQNQLKASCKFFATSKPRPKGKPVIKPSRNPTDSVPKAVKKKLTVSSNENPFKGTFTEEMDWSDRWEAIQKLPKDIHLTEGLSMILSDPELGVKGSLAIGKEFEKHRRLVAELTPGAHRASLIHSGIDQLMAEEHQRAAKAAEEQGHQLKISCFPGCNACCHRLIGVTEDEAELLTSELKRIEGGEISAQTLEKLESQAKYNLGEIDEWNKQHKSKRRCVFLSKDGLCSIYKNRPAACRTHQVLSDPYLCSPEASKLEGEEPEQLWYPLTESLSSAAVTNSGPKYLPLARAILKQVDKEFDERTKELKDANQQLNDLQRAMGMETPNNSQLPELPQPPQPPK